MSDSDTRARHALIIGIDEYVNLDKKYTLQGCVNDARLIGKVLQENLHFAPECITYLLNEQATRQGILDALDALVKRIGKDDIVVLHYSGHGSQKLAVNPDEPSGLNSTIVSYDSGRKPLPNLDIVDDEIAVWLAKLAQVTRYATLIFDCCHSGTMTRDAFGATPRWVETDTRAVTEAGVAVPNSLLSNPEYALPASAKRDVAASGWLKLSDGYVMISGCRDDETSNEYVPEGATGGRNGALTHFLVQELLQSAPGTTYRDMYERVRRAVSTLFTAQHPQIEGQQDRELFGIRDIEPLRSVAVADVQADSVVLAGGTAHGMTIGSQWRVFAEASKAGDASDGVALVEITVITAVSATAKVIEAGEPLVAGMRAVEVAHALTNLQFAVRCVVQAAGQDAAVAQLKSQLAASKLLRVLDVDEPANSADACLYLLAPRDSVTAADAAPMLAHIAAPSWALVDKQGLLAAPLHTVDEAGVAALLCDNLEKFARYRNALALTNSDLNSSLRNKVDLTVYRQVDGAWHEALPNERGEVRFVADERIAFEINHSYNAPLFVSVLDFGLSGGVSLMYPQNRESYKVEPNTKVRVGFADNEAIALYIPPTFARDDGTETFKLFATTSVADFSWLQQQGMRDVRAAASANALTQLFALAYNGPATRDVRQQAPAPQDDWTTVAKSFVLAKKQGGL